MMFSGDHKSERTCILGSAIFYCSDSEHEMEGELLKLLRQTKEAGWRVSTRDGKMKAKLKVKLDPPRYLPLADQIQGVFSVVPS